MSIVMREMGMGAGRQAATGGRGGEEKKPRQNVHSSYTVNIEVPTEYPTKIREGQEALRTCREILYKYLKYTVDLSLLYCVLQHIRSLHIEGSTPYYSVCTLG